MSLHTMPIRPEDQSFLFDVYASTRLDELQAWGWDEAMQHQFLTMQAQAQQQSYSVQYPGADHRLIIFQNVRTGRIIVHRTDEVLTLVDLSLLPAYRNQGIGTRLIRALQDKAAASGLPLRLSVLQANPARRLYQRLGFRSAGGDELYDSMEWLMTSGHAKPSDNISTR
ncbi:MAG TPA: GNAT family N-acetyltransferase [Bacilli bacterium]|nr:GNAT family N-acetyltransferase [Bacilli bacterium]